MTARAKNIFTEKKGGGVLESFTHFISFIVGYIIFQIIGHQRMKIVRKLKEEYSKVLTDQNKIVFQKRFIKRGFIFRINMSWIFNFNSLRRV